MKRIIRLTERDLTRIVKRIINEKLKYDPKKVVHMDDEHIVINKKRKPNNKYKKKDVSYEDDEWMVIDLEETEGELKEQNINEDYVPYEEKLAKYNIEFEKYKKELAKYNEIYNEIKSTPTILGAEVNGNYDDCHLPTNLNELQKIYNKFKSRFFNTKTVTITPLKRPSFYTNTILSSLEHYFMVLSNIDEKKINLLMKSLKNKEVDFMLDYEHVCVNCGDEVEKYTDSLNFTPVNTTIEKNLDYKTYCFGSMGNKKMASFFKFYSFNYTGPKPTPPKKPVKTQLDRDYEATRPQELTKQKNSEDYYFDPRLNMYVKRRKVSGTEKTGTNVGGISNK